MKMMFMRKFDIQEKPKPQAPLEQQIAEKPQEAHIIGKGTEEKKALDQSEVVIVEIKDLSDVK